MNFRYVIVVAAAAALLVGCGAEKPELNKADQASMDKLFREGIKPNNGNAPGATPGSKDGKAMNQDTG